MDLKPIGILLGLCYWMIVSCCFFPSEQTNKSVCKCVYIAKIDLYIWCLCFRKKNDEGEGARGLVRVSFAREGQ